MDFTVEGKIFRAMSLQAEVLSTPACAPAQETVVSLGDPAGTELRLPRGKKDWQAVALRLALGVEVLLPLPQSFALAPGDVVTLGCLGPADGTEQGFGDQGAVLDVYAVGNAATGTTHEFTDAVALMKRCGLTRATEYEVEKYPLKKVCKVSAIVFLVGLVCFGFLMHLFTESTDELMQRLPDVLLMTAKFGGVSALVVAAGGGLFVKSSNDYNSRKKFETYVRQFEQAMAVTLGIAK